MTFFLDTTQITATRRMGSIRRQQLQLLALMAIAMAMAMEAEGIIGRPPSNCNRSCGGIHIPYPIGLENDDESCYRSADYTLVCNHSSNPPKLFSPGGNLEITELSLSPARVSVLFDVHYACYHRGGGGSPIQVREYAHELPLPARMSHTENVFMAIGCETLATFRIGKSFGGCISGCNGLDEALDGECTGFGCCQTAIPKDVVWYGIKFYDRSNGSEIFKFNDCSYAFIVKKNNYTFRRSDLVSMGKNRLFPVVIDWAIRDDRDDRDDLNCKEAMKDPTNYACVSDNSDCFDSQNGPGYTCNCSQGYRGNPYLHGGCQDIDECKHPELYTCYGTCKNRDGDYDCYCEDGFQSINPKTHSCRKRDGSKLPLYIAKTIGSASGLFLLLLAIAFTYLHQQKKKLRKLREMYFQQNGGSFLKEILSSTHHQHRFKIFTIEEMEIATKNFRSDRILGRGGVGTVYRGKLENGMVIAVKKSSVVDEKKSREFANELFIISQINHRNVVKLLGCCLEVEIPMLVYEYIPNGTLFSYLHGSGETAKPFPFGNRMKIAREASHALKYLHMDASPPIFHGDVKSSNILLDGNYVAKISDFGTSTLAPKDESQFTTLIHGTCGYLDPEYLRTSKLTSKSDVYSFGVVLMELLSRKVPFKFDGGLEEEMSLASNFISCMKQNRMVDILDVEVAREEGVMEQVRKVAKLAMECVALKGEDRPTMHHVELQLNALESVDVRPWIPPDKMKDHLGTSHSFSPSYDNSAAWEIQDGR